MLIAFSDAEPIWKSAVPAEMALPYIRETARKCLSAPSKSEAGAQFRSRISDQPGYGFKEFVDRWFAMRGEAEYPKEELLGIIFFQTAANQKVNIFFSEKVGVDGFLVKLNQLRDRSWDETMISGICEFEFNLYRGGRDAWEAEFLRERVVLNPFVDLSYPLAKGYLYKTMFDAARALFSDSFGRDDLSQLARDFQARFGPLEYPEVWEDLAA
jgi:hypothetical protein